MLIRASYAQMKQDCQPIGPINGKSAVMDPRFVSAGFCVDDRLADSISFSRDFEISPRGGIRVDVYLNNGIRLFGDLLLVGDTLITLYAHKDFSTDPSPERKTGAYIIRTNEVSRIGLRGRSKVLEGMVIGLVSGMITGAVKDRVIESGKAGASSPGLTVFGGIGLVVGASIGILDSNDDLILSKLDSVELRFLKTLSRYPKDSPH
jgi:hypothetical protein